MRRTERQREEIGSETWTETEIKRKNGHERKQRILIDRDRGRRGRRGREGERERVCVY